jgi:broad specificity phosphatase PhoE
MKINSKIILARRGETNWNHQGKMQGRTDIPSMKQEDSRRHQLHKKLLESNIDVAYSLTLSRAIETAELL